MVKSAGIFKKLKKVGNLLGKGASWVNNNIVKPMKPLINQGISFGASALGVPMAGDALNSALDIGSNWLDDKFGSKSNKQIQNAARFGADLLMDTQRSKNDKKYINYLSYSDDEDEEYISPPRKSYSNPFGKRIN